MRIGTVRCTARWGAPPNRVAGAAPPCQGSRRRVGCPWRRRHRRRVRATVSSTPAKAARPFGAEVFTAHKGPSPARLAPSRACTTRPPPHTLGASPVWVRGSAVDPAILPGPTEPVRSTDGHPGGGAVPSQAPPAAAPTPAAVPAAGEWPRDRGLSLRPPQTLTGNVVDRHNPAYPAARLDNNHRIQRFPKYIAFCASVNDVQNNVLWSREHHLPLRARSGRHSYEDFSIVDGGVVIDVSPLNSVVLDAAGGTAQIGAGATLGQIYDALWDQGMVTIPGGGCVGVGVAGLTLGGGFGFLTRLFGLTCDSVLGLEMVTACGDLIRADANHHADLFWASCGGGGGNFGVTTAFTFKAQPVDNVTVFSILWPWAALRPVFAAWQAWADPERLDHHLTPILILPAKSAGFINAIGEFVGPQAELEALIQPLLAAAPPADVKVVYESYIDAVHRFVGTQGGGTAPHAAARVSPEAWRWALDRQADQTLDKFKNTSAFQFQPFDQLAIETMIALLERSPSPNTEVQFNLHGGAESRVGDHATAYPWRSARYSLQYQAYWSDPADGPALIRWVEGFRRAMLPWTGGAYVNYIDIDIVDWPTAYYDDNIRRLVEVKRRYDPDNVFDFPQGIGRIAPR